MGVMFGTDGVRGIANRELTPELAFQLGRAGAYVLTRDREKRSQIVIGKDTRISGDMLEGALIAGICSVGVDVLRAGVMPTPGTAYLTRELGASAGVMISASHNPVEDNGIKFFAGNGYKLPDQVEEEIEKLVLEDNPCLPAPVGRDVGKVCPIDDAEARYADYAQSTVSANLRGLKIVVDCANGAAYRVTPRTLEMLGAEVIAINAQPDGANINLGCGSTHPEGLQEAVVKHGAHLGLAHDGDADRVLAVDEWGNLVDGDQIMVACALDLKERGLLVQNTVVVTVMSNLGLHLALKEAKIDVRQTKVGDRYVLEDMLNTGAVLGGEQSGHVIFLQHNTTGDGLITGLQLLDLMARKGKSLSELAGQMQKLPQKMVNVRVTDKEKAMAHPGVRDAISRAEETLGNTGRILVRPSGTEPLIRIMAEGPDEKILAKVLEQIEEAVRQVQ